MTMRGKKRFWAKVLAFMLIASMMVGNMATSSFAAAIDNEITNVEKSADETVMPADPNPTVQPEGVLGTEEVEETATIVEDTDTLDMVPEIEEAPVADSQPETSEGTVSTSNNMPDMKAADDGESVSLIQSGSTTSEIAAVPKKQGRASRAYNLNPSGDCTVKVYVKAGFGVDIKNAPNLGYWPIQLKKDRVGSNNPTFEGTVYFIGDNTNGWTAWVRWTCGNASGTTGPFGTITERDMSEYTKSNSTGVSFSSSVAETTFNLATIYSDDGKPIQYKVTYVGDGGTFSDGTAQKEYIANKNAKTPSVEAPQRENYTFTGWAPTVAATVTKDVTYTAQWERNPDKPVDNGNGITVTKTRTSDPTAELGDEITWDITVTNNSNVEKEVTLTEQLTGAYFTSTNSRTVTITLAEGESKTITAKYTVKESDTGIIKNTVAASTGGTGDKENTSAADEGTEIVPVDDTYTVIYKDSAEYGGTEFQRTEGLNKGDPTPGYSSSWFEGKDKDFNMWTPKRQSKVDGENHTITYTAVYKSGRVKYPFKIFYVWSGATENAAPDYTDEFFRGESYNVESPTLNVPFDYAVNYRVINGTVGYTSSDVKYWVTYTPVVKIQHIYRENGNVVGKDFDTTTKQLSFGQTLTENSYGIKKQLSYEGKTYAYTSADTITLPSEPSQLTEQPVLKLYYDRTQKETHNVIVHYKWAGTDVKAAEDQVKLVEEGEFYLINSPTGIATAMFQNIITDNAKMTISGIMGTGDIEYTVYYSPQYQMKYVLQENGVTKYARYYNGIWPGVFGRTYTANIKIGDSYWAGDPTWGDYYCTRIENVVFPSDPTTLSETPAITLYFNKTIPATLAVTKKADKTEVAAGETVEYTITVENTGTVAAKDVKVKDILNANLEFVESTINGTDGIYTIGDIPVGESRTLTIKTKVTDTAIAGTEITNTATAEYTNKPENVPEPSGEAKITVTDEKNSDDDEVTITLRYVSVDEDGNETGVLQSNVEISAIKDAVYDVNDQVPETLTKDGQSYRKDSVDGELKGTAEDDITITVKYLPESQEGPDDLTPTPPTPLTPPMPTPTPTSTPTPAAVLPIGPTVIPAATPTAAAPAATPEAEPVEDIADTETPLAAEPDAPAEDIELEEEAVPLAAGKGGSWALINFALMNLAIFESIMLLIGYFVKTKNDKDEEEEEEKRKLKKKGIVRILSTPVAVISLIAFILTEDITLPTGFVDKYTIWMAVIAIVQTVVVALSNKKYQDEEEEA